MPEVSMMMEMKTTEGHCCRFLTIGIILQHVPSKGDAIELISSGKNRFTSLVQYVHHLYGDQQGTIICCSSSFKSQQDMLAAIELLRDKYKLTDFDADEPPPRQYVAYRTLVKLWGDNVFKANDSALVIGEVIKAIYEAGGGTKKSMINAFVESLQGEIISHKTRYKSDNVELFDVFMKTTGDKDIINTMATAMEDDAKIKAISRLKALKSVEKSQLPWFMK